MKRICGFTYTLLTILILFTSTAYTYYGIEGYTPDGAIQRFGKGYAFDFDYSPEGSHLAVASTIGIWIYDGETRKEIKLLKGHTHFVKSVVFSPNAKILASSGSHGTIMLWDVYTGKVIDTLKGHTGDIYPLVFSHDGSMLVSGSDDELIKIWDLNYTQIPITIPGHIDGVTSIAISPDQNMFASSGNSDYRISLWKLENGEFIRFLEGHVKGINTLNFLSDGTLVSGSDDGTIQFWNTLTGKLLKTYKGNSAVISQNNKKFAAKQEDGSIQILDIHTDNLLQTIKTSDGNVHDIKFSPDSRILTTSNGLEIHFWNIETGSLIATISGYSQGIGSVKFSQNALTLVSLDDYIRIWDIAGYKHKKTLTSIEASISSIGLAPDNETIAIGGYDNIIYLRDMRTDRNKIILKGHTEGIASLIFSPDGKKLASTSWDDSIRLWDTITGEHITTITDEAFSSRNIEFSKAGNSLVFVDRNSSIIFWNLDTLNIEKEIGLDSNYPYSIALSHDGKTLAIGYDNEEIQLLDVSTQEVIRTIHTVGRTDQLDFSPDGQTLAGCGEDIYLWNVKSGKLINTFKGHIDQVFTITFSPNGKTLVSGGWDSTIIVWEILK